MKWIISSDKCAAVNAEQVDVFLLNEMHSNTEIVGYEICAGSMALSFHADEQKAIKEFNKLMNALAQDNLPLLYQMEDTD